MYKNQPPIQIASGDQGVQIIIIPPDTGSGPLQGLKIQGGGVVLGGENVPPWLR